MHYKIKKDEQDKIKKRNEGKQKNERVERKKQKWESWNIKYIVGKTVMNCRIYEKNYS